MQIPFHKSYTDKEDIDKVIQAINSGWLTMGPMTVEFENKFKAEVRAKHAVAVNSCTAAMHLALKVIGIQPGDEVIIPAMTFTATGEVVRYFDAHPVIVDVDKDYQNITPSEIEKHLSPKTKAIIPVHFGGNPAPMNEIVDIAKQNDLKVIEDAAHCFPTFYHDQPIGSIGDITAFSFYATKTIACGEGGMATTENDEYAEAIRVLRLHGISKDAWKRYSDEGSWYYEVIDAGYKYNTTDIQAGLGLAQLAKATMMWDKRKKIARTYNHGFENNPLISTPEESPDSRSSWHLYVIKLKTERLKLTRNEFIEKLSEKGIKTSVHFIPLYRHPYYQKMYKIPFKKMPNSEWLFERIISLPIFPGMTEVQINYVIDNVTAIAKENAR